MPNYKHGDTVRIISGEYNGKTGAIFGSPHKLFAVSKMPVAEGQEIAGKERYGNVSETVGYPEERDRGLQIAWTVATRLRCATIKSSLLKRTLGKDG